MSIELTTDFAGLSNEDWFDALDDVAEEHGHFERVGANHAAAFIDHGKKLLVTFETFPEICEQSEMMEPRGFQAARDFGWSHLAIVARGESWFRDLRLYQYFDRLTDDGFFEDFDEVLFFGTHRGGYAAGAYAVAAPGSRVLSIRPVATLDPQIANWDRRYLEARRTDFSTRYGFAPDMIDATQHTFVVFDPQEDLDAMHAALFTRSNVTKLRMPRMGTKLDHNLDEMGILLPLMEYAMNGDLTEASFAELYRSRRDFVPYLRQFVGWLERKRDYSRAAAICRYVLSEGKRPYFAQRLRQIEEKAAREEKMNATRAAQ